MNKDTFGEDAPGGWTFEENLEANERIAADKLNAGQAGRGARGEGHSSTWTTLAACVRTAHSRRPGDRGPPCLADAWNEEPLTACSTSFGAGSGDTVSVATSDGSGSTGKPRDPRTEIEVELCDLLSSTPVLRRTDFDGLVRQYLHAIRTADGREGVTEAIQMLRDAAADKKRADVKRWPAYISALLKRHLQELKQNNSLIKVRTSLTMLAATPAAPGPDPAMAYQ
jgi:hypothetical protein